MRRGGWTARAALSVAALAGAAVLLWRADRSAWERAPSPAPGVHGVKLPPMAAPQGERPEPPAGEPTALVPPPPSLPAWRRFAGYAAPDDGRPMIAIVIDDVGLDRRHSAEAVALPAPLTLSYLAYADDLPTQTASARAHGHELMLHIPMEPKGEEDPGPHALYVAAAPDDIASSIEWDLARLDGIAGANNHMGSRFCEWAPGMTIVADRLAARGLFFLDSMTSAKSVGWKVTEQAGVPTVRRDVFLDDVRSVQAVAAELARTEAVARRTGQAIAIGHPHEATLAALRAWLPTVAAKGFRLVPVSAIVARDQARVAD